MTAARRPGRWMGVLVGCLVGVAACEPAPAEPEGPLDAFYDQEMSWEDCGEGFECATFEVPLDYDAPDGARLEIAAMRLPASGSDPIGSLVINPGGPGGSGLAHVRGAPAVLDERVRDRFHVVGFDPRGVGASEPIHCLDAEGLDEYLGKEIPRGEEPGEPPPAGVAQLERASEEFAAACEEGSGELLAHVGTADVARDMDILRELVGDQRLNYLGKSYGTYIGAHYAERFPERIRAMVLDGAMDPSLSLLEMGVEQVAGFEAALRAFVADCQTRPDCPLATEEAGEEAAVDVGVGWLTELVEDANERPLENGLGDDREVNGAWVRLGVLAALYREEYWPSVREALSAAEDGDGTGLLALADHLYGRQEEDRYENGLAALHAVNCVDRPRPASLDTYERAAAEAADDSAIFGPSLVWGALVCLHWPVEPAVEQGEITAAGADPILVVGTVGDPATPHVWAERLAADLESGVLLSYEGHGHTAYGRGDDCVDRAVDDYLLEAEPPKRGTVCEG